MTLLSILLFVWQNIHCRSVGRVIGLSHGRLKESSACLLCQKHSGVQSYNFTLSNQLVCAESLGLLKSTTPNIISIISNIISIISIITISVNVLVLSVGYQSEGRTRPWLVGPIFSCRVKTVTRRDGAELISTDQAAHRVSPVVPGYCGSWYHCSLCWGVVLSTRHRKWHGYFYRPLWTTLSILTLA